MSPSYVVLGLSLESPDLLAASAITDMTHLWSINAYMKPDIIVCTQQ